MFWALNGATRTPCRASERHSPAVSTLFPASEVVPATSSPPFTGRSVQQSSGQQSSGQQWSGRRRPPAGIVLTAVTPRP